MRVSGARNSFLDLPIKFSFSLSEILKNLVRLHPIPTGFDDDVDTDKASAPYILVQMTGGEIADDNSPQTVDFSIVICAYDEGIEREGYQDVANIKEDIIQQICSAPYFGGSFTILKPIAWALQADKSDPYYYGACVLTCTAPAMTQDSVLKELI